MSYLTTCRSCGKTTSKQYAKAHGGECKSCHEPQAITRRLRSNKEI